MNKAAISVIVMVLLLLAGIIRRYFLMSDNRKIDILCSYEWKDNSDTFSIGDLVSFDSAVCLGDTFTYIVHKDLSVSRGKMQIGEVTSVYRGFDVSRVRFKLITTDGRMVEYIDLFDRKRD